MCNKLFLLMFAVLLLILAGNATAKIDPATVTTGHVYLFDNVTGTQLPDDSANNNAGTIVGNPQVVAGLGSKALHFDGAHDGVQIPDSAHINTGGPWPNRTVVAVFNCDNVNKPGKQTIWDEGGRTRGMVIYVFAGQVYVGAWNRAEYNWNGAWLSAPISSNTWYAVAFVLRGGTEAVEDNKFEMWLDGELVGEAPGGQMHGHGDNNGIGFTNQNTRFHDDDGSGSNRDFFGGSIDEVWILNDALTGAELGAWQSSKTWPYANGPTPSDGAKYEDTWVSLSWMPGAFTASHNVYLGDNFDDVNNATPDSNVFRGNQGTTFYVAGFPGYAFPDGLVPGTTYYWRIDEVNDAEPNSPWKGSVWSFFVPSLDRRLGHETALRVFRRRPEHRGQRYRRTAAGGCNLYAQHAGIGQDVLLAR
jgi:Concanavalin A-like lectin/glucanases superfamily